VGFFLFVFVSLFHKSASTANPMQKNQSYCFFSGTCDLPETTQTLLILLDKLSSNCCAFCSGSLLVAALLWKDQSVLQLSLKECLAHLLSCTNSLTFFASRAPNYQLFSCTSALINSARYKIHVQKANMCLGALNKTSANQLCISQACTHLTKLSSFQWD